MEINGYQQEMMESANHGFCYDANPSCWDSKNERNQMEQLVKMGLMKISLEGIRFLHIHQNHF